MIDQKNSVGFDFERVLLRLGALLFMLGLLTGFVSPVLEIPRVGLTSHLEGLLNGLMLMALGLMWPRLALGRGLQRLTFGLAVYAAFANWLATLLSAALGAGALMPIAANGRIGDAASEAIVSFLLLSLSFAIVIAFVLVLHGLRRVRR